MTPHCDGDYLLLTFLLGDESCFATGARLRSTTLLVTKGVLGLNDVLVHA